MEKQISKHIICEWEKSSDMWSSNHGDYEGNCFV